MIPPARAFDMELVNVSEVKQSLLSIALMPPYSDFPLSFEDAFFAAFPAGCFLLLALIVSASPSSYNDGFTGRKTSFIVALALLMTLHIASLALYCVLPAVSDLRSHAGLLAYAARALAMTIAFVCYLRLPSRILRLLGLYLLLSVVLDSFKLRTLWPAFAASGNFVSACLVAAQTAILGISATFLIFEALTANRVTKKSDVLQINEQSSSTLGVLLFGWVWPLLSVGSTTKLSEKDLQHIRYHPNAAHYETTAHLSAKVAREFTIAMVLQYSWMLLLSLLAAVATLLQPFIIGGIVGHLDSTNDSSVGVWLVIAMFIDKWIVALCVSHTNHRRDQLKHRVKSYIVQKIFQRSLAPGSQDGTAESVSAKAVVHASVDAEAAVFGPEVAISIVSNSIIVIFGSYMLHRQIGLAFLGPLVLALLGTAVPASLGSAMADTQRSVLEATEKRVQATKHLVSDVRNIRIGGLQDLTADQVLESRKLEIDRATDYRRILVVVIVVALSMNSLCTLAAFGFFSLQEGARMDYTRLFTSLSILVIMIQPLLENLQSIPGLVLAIVSWQRIRKYVYTPTDASFFANRRTVLEGDSGSSPTFRDVEEIDYAVKLDRATIGWTSEKAELREISLVLEPGKVAMVTGGSASGKSTLLKVILGEAQVHSGHVDLQTTRIAYCDQVPWFIPDESLRYNIVLGKRFDQVLYDNVVKSSCLAHDFTTKENGDATVIDSKGSSLSGGQRARLALARALYSEPELLLLDEIFTGLDRSTAAQVAEHLFGLHGFLSARPSMAVLMCSTVVPPALVRSARLQLYHLDSGAMSAIDNSTASTTIGVDDMTVHDSSQTDGKENDIEVADESSGPKLVEEGTEESRSSFTEYREYLKSFGSAKNFARLAVLFVIWEVSEKGFQLWLTRWTSMYENPDTSVDSGFYIEVYAGLTGLYVLAIIGSLCIYFLSMIPQSGITVHKNMFNAFHRSPVMVIEATKSQIINRFTSDIAIIDINLPMNLLNFAAAVGSIAASAFVIGLGTPYAIIAVVFVVSSLWFLQSYYLKTSSQLRVMQMASQAPVVGTLSSSLDGRLTLRAFGLNDRMMKHMSERLYDAHRPGYFFLSAQSWVMLVLDCGSIFVVTLVAALLVGMRSRAVGLGGVALLNATALTMLIQWIMYSWTGLEMSMGSLTRILNYIRNTPMEDTDGIEVEPAASWPLKGNVEIKKLSLAYGTKDVVNEVSLMIPAGTKIAILGRTGSGKTSLIQAFFGLIRISGGSVEVDGVDLSTVPADSLRKRLSGNPQQTFSNGMATLRCNLDPYEQCSDAEIRTVVDQIAVDSAMRDDILSKLDSKWEECNFSTSWQKRIGLVRTVLRKSTVYILDEPTSGMDDESHGAIMDCIFNALADKTVIVITHTVAAIERFDRVAVMADGELVESARPAELLADPSSQLYRYVHASSPTS